MEGNVLGCMCVSDALAEPGERQNDKSQANSLIEVVLLFLFLFPSTRHCLFDVLEESKHLRVTVHSDVKMPAHSPVCRSV